MSTKTPKGELTRRTILTGAAATLVAAKATLPAGALAAAGPETGKIRLGFIALTDCSPLVIAKERGIFDKFGLPDVELVKQASWASTRDNLVLGSGGGGIDGAHILTPMPYLMALGTITNGKPVPMNILCRLNVNGQGISVSNALRQAGVGLNSSGLKARFAEMKRNGDTAKVAMTFRGGTHDLWLRYWLAAGGINPDVDCETIVIPPPQMVANMRAGTQDAFCVGEPWNAQLVNQKLGYTACTSSEIWMNHPEKALGVRADWVGRHPRAAEALVRAVMESQQWCDQMRNRQAMCSIVAGRQYINVPINDILPRLTGSINYDAGRTVSGSPHIMKFWADNASFPWKSHDKWFLTENIRWGNIPAGTDLDATVNRVNRSDIWRSAARGIGVQAPAGDSRGIERFFDGKTFDPANPQAYLSSLAIKKA